MILKHLKTVHLPSLFLCVAYMLTLGITTYYHEPWGDEYQAWMRALTLNNWHDFLVIPGGEGHPPLWYWLLRALSYFTSFEHARYITLGFGLATCTLLAKLTKRRTWLLALCLFSAPILFWWSLPFRPYALLLPLILGAIYFFQKHDNAKTALCLGLACGLHFFGFFFLPLFGGAELLRSKSIHLAKTLFVPCSIILASTYFSGASNIWLGTSYAAHPTLTFFITAFAPFALWLKQLDAPTYMLIWQVLSLSFAAAIYLLFNDKKCVLVLAATLLACLAFMTIIYGHNFHHIFLLTLLVITSALLHIDALNKWALSALLIFNVAFGIYCVQKDILGNFSNAQTTYKAIQNSAYASLPIFVYDDQIFTPTAYTQHVEYYSLAMGKKTNGLIDWSHRHPTTTQQQTVYNAAGAPNQFLILFDAPTSSVPISRRSMPVQEVCNNLHASCTLVLQTKGAFKENADIYLATKK